MLNSAHLARVLAALALGLAALLPTGFLLLAALPRLWDGGWLAHFLSTTLPAQAATSLMVALEATVVAFLMGAVPAVIVSRHRFAGRGWVTALCLLPLGLATHVIAGTWTTAFSHPFFEGRHALALAHGFTCAPYLYIVFRIAASRMPGSLAEMAAALGAGPWQRLWRVHAPGYAVPVAAGVLIVFAQAVGDYAAAERLGIPTVSVGLHNLWLASQQSWVAAIVSCVVTVPALAMVVVAAWASTRLISQNPVPPAAAAAGRRSLGRGASLVLLAWCALCSLPAFWIPEALTLRWAWLKWDRTRFAAIPGDTANSVLTALATVSLVALACLAAALLMRSGGRSRWAERAPWLFLANYFLPSLVLALAFVMMSRDGSWLAAWLGPWRDTRLLIVVAEALRFMPLVMLPVLDALRRTPPAMIEAARAFGAGPVRARAVAFAGHLLPALALGCALVFIESLKELDLSLTLQPFGYNAASLKIYAFSRNQNMDRAAVWVLITQALMLLPLAWLGWRLHRLGGVGPAKEGM